MTKPAVRFFFILVFTLFAILAVSCAKNSPTAPAPLPVNSTPTPALQIISDIYENDNSPALAKPIYSNIIQNKSLNVCEDEDWVSFTITAISNVTLSVNSSTYITYIECYDGSNTTTANGVMFDGDGVLPNSASSFGLNPGTYYSGVRAWNYLAPGCDVFNYTLSLNITKLETPTQTETETIEQTITETLTITPSESPTIISTLISTPVFTDTFTQTTTNTVFNTPSYTNTSSPYFSSTATYTYTPTVSQTQTFTQTTTPTLLLPDIYEPDDIYSQAFMLTPGDTQFRNIAPENDKDMVKFTVTYPSIAKIDITGAFSEIYNVDYFTLPENYLNFSICCNSSVSVVQPCLTPGIYYIQIYGAPGVKYPSYQLDFSLIQMTPTSTDTSTCTYTSTFTLTLTSTITPTKTATMTFTNSPTKTESWTITQTHTISPTRSNTPTITVTATITMTKTPGWSGPLNFNSNSCCQASGVPGYAISGNNMSMVFYSLSSGYLSFDSATISSWSVSNNWTGFFAPNNYYYYTYRNTNSASATNGQVVVKKYDSFSSSWLLVGSSGSSGTGKDPSQASLFVDPVNGGLYSAFINRITNKPEVLTYNSDSWMSLGDAFTPKVKDTAIVLDGYNQAGISHLFLAYNDIDDATGNSRLAIAHYDGSTWDPQYGGYISLGVTFPFDVSIDQFSKEIYVAYRDIDNMLHVKKYF